MKEVDRIEGVVRTGSGHVSRVIVGERLSAWSAVAQMPLVPGTLNIQPPNIKVALAWLGAPLYVTEPDGKHGALKWWPVRLNVSGGPHDVFVIRVEKSGTPFLEIVAPVHFRAIGVQDGDTAVITRRGAPDCPPPVSAVARAPDIVPAPPPGPIVRAMVIGGGSNVWDDIKALEALYGGEWDGLVIGVNDVVCHWPRPVDHWVTLHPDKFKLWRALRATNKHPSGYITWTRRNKNLADRGIIPWAGGSSGMLAAQVAREVGANRVVLCGVPMTKTPHFKESTVHISTKTWAAADAHWRAWKNTLPKVHGWLTSMSGRTRDLLGAPTVEWLKGDNEEIRKAA